MQIPAISGWMWENSACKYLQYLGECGRFQHENTCNIWVNVGEFSMQKPAISGWMWENSACKYLQYLGECGGIQHANTCNIWVNVWEFSMQIPAISGWMWENSACKYLQYLGECGRIIWKWLLKCCNYFLDLCGLEQNCAVLLWVLCWMVLWKSDYLSAS